MEGSKRRLRTTRVTHRESLSKYAFVCNAALICRRLVRMHRLR